MHYGVDFSELDVHVAHHDELVVTHDMIQDPALENALPRLSEVFDLVRGRMGIYVELKGDRTAEALGDLIRRGAARDVRLISGSFVLEMVAELREAAPEVPRSILFGPGWEVEPMIAACHELGVAYAHPCFRPIERSLITAFHQAGLLVMTPHTNDAVEAHYFADIGVDVIASDDPRILRKLTPLPLGEGGGEGSPYVYGQLKVGAGIPWPSQAS
jgi:glycerophosphoryl diester phosphodiesterase